MGMKDKIKTEALTISEPIFTSNIQKSKFHFVVNLLRYIVLTATGMCGYVLITGKTIEQTATDIHKVAI